MTKPLNDTIARVTERVIANSRDSRAAYLDLMDRALAENAVIVAETTVLKGDKK